MECIAVVETIQDFVFAEPVIHSGIVEASQVSNTFVLRVLRRAAHFIVHGHFSLRDAMAVSACEWLTTIGSLRVG